MFQVEYEHYNDGLPLKLDLNHTTTKVGNQEKVLITASLSGMTFVLKI